MGVFFILLVGSSYDLVTAQTVIRHIPPSFIEKHEEVILRFEALEIAESEVIEALLFYRTQESGSYSQREVRFESGAAEIPILIEDSDAYSLEYYFILRTAAGRQYHYPDIIANEPPVYVELVSPRIEAFPTTDLLDVAIITPAAGETISNNDYLLTAALFYDGDGLENNIRLHINGEDVTELAEITPYLIKFRRDEISSGRQTVQILLDEGGTLYQAERWSFNVLRSATAGGDPVFTERSRVFGGDIELGAGSQYIAGSATDQLTGRLNVRGREGKLQYRGRGYLTTRESSRFQPQNRFHLDLRYGQSLFLEAGDANPNFSNYSIRGRRVRGVYGGVSFWDDRFRFEALRGTLQRSISNRFDQIEVVERELEQGVEELYYLNLEENGRGAYRRVLTGGRLDIGQRDRFRFSLNALRARDDSTSTTRYRDYRDVLLNNRELISSLTIQQQSFLEDNPDELQVTTALPRPKDNLTIGTEVEFSADNQRVRVHSEFAASLMNEDISAGVLNRERADELGIDLNGDVESLFNSLSWLIIINERMSTLPFKYRETESGTTEIDLFLPTSIFASETRVDLNYGSHRIEANYTWVGPDFQSLTNSTIRRDVSGITITDRFRTLSNRLIVTGGFELLRDNVNNYKNSTLRTRTLRFSAGWYPFRFDLPRVNAGIRYRTRGNNIDRFNPYVDRDIENTVVRNFAVVDGDTVSTSLPRSDKLIAFNTSISQGFSLMGAEHDAGISLNITDSQSDVTRYGDYSSSTFSFSLQSNFEGRPFQTRLAWNRTNSTALSGLNEANIQSIDTGVNWQLMENRLILNSTLSFARSQFQDIPLTVMEGDLESGRDSIYEPNFSGEEASTINTYLIRLRAEYRIFTNGSLEGLFNYSSIHRRGSDFAALPNDRIIQLRYIHRF
ncbi:hypothetical protein [Rhodohalobacter halophilus]|uniref:hypothetical protein n=1 Tax=Rhodohalobacter halophilus TaxID=1812810 RepID=UPI00114CAE40|nr:hypothetical protein [Rhodohalobacter halophilus]